MTRASVNDTLSRLRSGHRHGDRPGTTPRTVRESRCPGGVRYDVLKVHGTSRACVHRSVRREGTTVMTQVSKVGTPEGSAGVADRILAAFDTMGLRNTRPRRLIAERLAALAAGRDDFTAHDLWRELQAVDPHIGRATVYRAVDVLLQQGLLDRVPFADGTHRYRVCGVSHHHHVTCTQCQRVIEVSECLPPELVSAIARHTDFSIEGHSLELFGRCADCRPPRG